MNTLRIETLKELRIDAALMENTVVVSALDELIAIRELKGEQVPFMYAICHPDGSAWMDEGCVALNESHLGVVLADLRRDTGEDYRMVPAFTHSEPVKVVVLPGINELIDACGCTPAVRDINVWDLAISEVRRLNPTLFSDKYAAGGIVKNGE